MVVEPARGSRVAEPSGRHPWCFRIALAIPAALAWFTLAEADMAA